MWQVHGSAHAIAAAALAVFALSCTDAKAQDTFINQNISGFNLPGVQLPQGHDEVRAADGTTCRSAISGSGAYVDVGVIGNPEQAQSSASFSAYGRLVIPLSSGVKRLDCSRLYELEVQRLEMELKLMQMGLNRGIAPIPDEPVASRQPEEDEAPVRQADNSASPARQEKGAARPDAKVELASASEDSWTDEGWTTEGRKP